MQTEESQPLQTQPWPPSHLYGKYRVTQAEAKKKKKKKKKKHKELRRNAAFQMSVLHKKRDVCFLSVGVDGLGHSGTVNGY